MEILLYFYIGSGTLLAILSLPLMAGKVKPNPFYGFRTSQTLENPNIWYLANKYFAKLQLLVALIIIVSAIGLSFIPNISVDSYALSVLSGGTSLVTVTVSDAPPSSRGTSACTAPPICRTSSGTSSDPYKATRRVCLLCLRMIKRELNRVHF